MKPTVRRALAGCIHATHRPATTARWCMAGFATRSDLTKRAQVKRRRGTMHTEVRVTGMSCEGCSAAVERVVGALDGVRAARVDHVSGDAHIEHDDTVALVALAEAIRDAGFDVAEGGVT
ncbi:MAG: heavy-metal-associated domain-containing protein [Gammaproteobacteria bacterium]|nr:heavy-metal-associated domain-containing protein [Gammaproteobacteria bacterium]